MSKVVNEDPLFSLLCMCGIQTSFSLSDLISISCATLRTYTARNASKKKKKKEDSTRSFVCFSVWPSIAAALGGEPREVHGCYTFNLSCIGFLFPMFYKCGINFFVLNVFESFFSFLSFLPHASILEPLLSLLLCSFFLFFASLSKKERNVLLMGKERRFR